MDETVDPLGRHACPGCGEQLFNNEEKCWKCGAVQPRPAAPTEETLAATPTETAETGTPASPPAPPPVVTEPTQTVLPALAAVPQGASAAGKTAAWALGLSVVGCGFPCLPLAPVGLWLALRARRTGDSPLAVAALIMAVLSTVSWLALTIFFGSAMFSGCMEVIKSP